MGTNYYKMTGFHADHIGKQSAGWRFLAQAETAPDWDSLVRLLRADPNVVDEYGNRHHPLILLGQIEGHASQRHNVGDHYRDVYSDGPADFYRGEFS